MKVLVPVRVSNPAPDLVSAVAEVLSAITEAMLNPLLVLFWMMIRSLPLVPRSVPPLIVDRLLPTLPVTSRPPEVIVLMPASVTV